MKHISLILFLIYLPVSSFSQTKTRKVRHDELDSTKIKSAMICKHLKPKKDVDTTIFIGKQLNRTQISEFARLWNTATFEKGAYKKTKYIILVYLKDGAKREFAAGKWLNEHKNHRFSFNDPKFFDRVWKEIKESITNK